jgi:hypothetical protein
LSASWVARDALAGVETAALQWRDGSAWRTLGSRAASDGTAGSLTADASSVPAGRRGVRLLVADAAGNVTAHEGETRFTGGAPDRFARFRSARISVTPAKGRAATVGGRRVRVVRIRVGGRVTLAGRLVDAAGRPLQGVEVQARGHRGTLVGRAQTGRDGRYRIVARPIAGGALRIGVPAGRDLLPARGGVRVVVEVVPRVDLAASATVSPAGQEVLFTGRISPAPGQIGLGSRKGVVLEWKDPVRRTWRPVVNARIRPDGTFAIPWSFNLSGLTIPMRVTVPAEVGWPLLPVRSGVVSVAVR